MGRDNNPIRSGRLQLPRLPDQRTLPHKTRGCPTQTFSLGKNPPEVQMRFATYLFVIFVCWTCWASLGWFIFSSPHVNHAFDWIMYGIGTALVLWFGRGAIFLSVVAIFGYLMKFLFWLKGN